LFRNASFRYQFMLIDSFFEQLLMDGNVVSENIS